MHAPPEQLANLDEAVLAEEHRQAWHHSLFARMPDPLLVACCLALLGIIGLADYLTGHELSSDLFYLVPVAVAAWHGGRAPGLIVGLAAAGLWQLVRAYERPDLHPAFHAWNGMVRLVFFVIAAALIARLRAALTREENLARLDSLTGALNRRFFYLLAQREIDLARRQPRPITVAYFDLDNFKLVNDRLGHAAGDDLLRTLAAGVRANIRGTDLFARLGGDEFALFLSDTDLEGGRLVLEKLRLLISERLHESAVTVSVGAITFDADYPEVEEMVSRADNLMYRIKREGKDSVCLVASRDPQEQ